MRILSKMKKAIEYIDTRGKQTKSITYLGLVISSLVLTVVLLLKISIEEVSVTTYEVHYLINELLNIGWLVILISIFGAALFEDMEKRG